MGCGSSNVAVDPQDCPEGASSVNTQAHRYKKPIPSAVLASRDGNTKKQFAADPSIDILASQGLSSYPMCGGTCELPPEAVQDLEELDSLAPREDGFKSYEPETPTWWISVVEEKAKLRSCPTPCWNGMRIENGITQHDNSFQGNERPSIVEPRESATVPTTLDNFQIVDTLNSPPLQPSPELSARVQSWMQKAGQPAEELCCDASMTIL